MGPKNINTNRPGVSGEGGEMMFEEIEKKMDQFCEGKTMVVDSPALLEKLRREKAHFGCGRGTQSIWTNDWVNEGVFKFQEFDMRCGLFPHCDEKCHSLLASKNPLEKPCNP